MFIRGYCARVAAVCLAVAAWAPARADLIVSVNSTTALAGSSGNWFDVTLKNDGASAVDLDGFSFALDAGSPDVTFTGVTTATADSYVFDGFSAYGPNIELWAGGDVSAADAYDPAGGSISLAAGGTVGLGRVFFDLDAGASGTYAVKLRAFPDTSLSLGIDDVAINTLVDGTITVGEAVPEPSAIVMGLLAAGAGLATAVRRRRPS